MTRDEVIVKLCAMMGKVYDHVDPSAERPCDCVCPDRNRGINHYRNEGHVLAFMQEAIDKALLERAADSVSEGQEKPVTKPYQSDEDEETYIHDDGTVQSASEFAAAHGLEPRPSNTIAIGSTVTMSSEVLIEHRHRVGVVREIRDGEARVEIAGVNVDPWFFLSDLLLMPIAPRPSDAPVTTEVRVLLSEFRKCLLSHNHVGAPEQDLPVALRRASLLARIGHVIDTPAPQMDKASVGAWRVGAKLGRTLYLHDQCIGIVDTPELAAILVRAANSQPVFPEARTDYPLRAQVDRLIFAIEAADPVVEDHDNSARLKAELDATRALIAEPCSANPTSEVK